MMKKSRIKGGTLVLKHNPSNLDVLIYGEEIVGFGQMPGFSPDIDIDATGLLIIPGGVDTHVHFNDSFMNTVSVHDYYTGTLAAAFGGVTSVIDFANQAQGQSLVSVIEAKHKEAQGRALVDWGVHPVITQPNDHTIQEIPLVIEKGAPTIKCYMTYREEGLLIEDEDLIDISKALTKSGGMLMLHAEDNQVIEKNVPELIRSGLTKPIYHATSRPIEAENRAIGRCIEIARKTGGRIFVVHLASAKGVQMIRTAKAQGVDILAETCTHYLVFTDQMLNREDGIKWICSPPLRDQHNQQGLWHGLQQGIISMVTSDDAAYSWKAKCLGKDRFDRCPNGIPGIEPRLSLLYSQGVAKGRLSVTQWVEMVSTAPAEIFELAPRKGSLTIGADADLVLFDPSQTWTLDRDNLHMAANWCAYEGLQVQGKVKMVFSRGELIIDGDRCLAEKGRGRYLHRTL